MMGAVSGEAIDTLIIGEGVTAEGHGWIALNKPSGISTHNGSRNESRNQSTEDALSLVESYLGSKAFPVHRLDRETSGVLLFATSQKSAAHFQTLIASKSDSVSDKSVQKIYRAVLRGRIEKSGSWNTPISDKAEGRDNPAGKASDQKEARTDYTVIRTNAFFTEVEVQLFSGRQHQIRKHARLAKHGIVGDTRYGELSHARKIASLYGTDRLMLHAERLELGSLTLAAPVPAEFSKLFESQSSSV